MSNSYESPSKVVFVVMGGGGLVGDWNVSSITMGTREFFKEKWEKIKSDWEKFFLYKIIEIFSHLNYMMLNPNLNSKHMHICRCISTEILKKTLHTVFFI